MSQNYSRYLGRMEFFNFSYLVLTLKKTFIDSFFLKFVLGLLTGMIGYFFDVSLLGQIQRVAVLVLFRFILGFYASRKRGEEFSEPKAIASVVKIGLYSICISSAHSTEQAIASGTNLFLDESIIGIIAAAELLSILKTAQGLGVPIPQFIFKKLEDFSKK